jgi:hypothetical protein
MTYHEYRHQTLELQTHIQFIGDPHPIEFARDLNFGDVIRFWYKGQDPPYNKLHERLVFVLNPEYKDKLHGLDMAYVSHDSLVEIIIPEMYTTYDPQKMARLVSFKDIIKSTDSYRTYFVNNMNYIERMSYQLHHGN